MSLKSRILRIFLIGLGVLAAVAYAIFATLFFNPLESDLDADVAALVPRDVDFFVAKSDLAQEFDTFPHLAVERRLAKHAAWKGFVESAQGKALAQKLRVEETLAQLAQATGQIPLGMQPQEIFGGKDLAIAGYFRGADLAQAEWAAYGRANWAGKVAAAALKHPDLLRLKEQGLTVELGENHVAVSGKGLPRKLYVTRIRDVVIVATAPALPQKARALMEKGYQDSFFQSAAYYDWIQKAPREGERDEFEVYVNARKAIDNLKLPAAWPDPKSQEFATALLARLFQLGSLKNAVGVVRVDEGVALDVHADLSTEQMTPEQERLYRTRGFDRDALLGEAARLAPRDTALFVCLNAPVADFLRMLLASCEPALRQNLEDAFRNTGKYPSLEKLIAELDAALKDRAVLIVRPNDYPPDPEGPEHNDEPVPAVALVLWSKDLEIVNSLRELLGQQGSKFGLRGRGPNDPGFFKNTEAGYETREYWSPLVPGTGIVVTANAAQLTIVTNTLGMMGDILKTYTQRSEKHPSLADDPTFSALVESSLARANALVWVNPKTLAPILRSRARAVAEGSFRFDAVSERARVEAKLLRTDFGGKAKTALSADDQAELDRRIDTEMNAMRKRLKEEQVPAIMAEQERRIVWAEAASAALLMVALDPKSLELSLRLLTPLPE